MKPRYFLPIILIALLAGSYATDPVDSPEPEVRQAIKLTTRHLPIHRYFADDDDDDSLTIAQQYLIVRRDTSIKTKTDISPTEDDVAISDGVRLRLMLARLKAMERFDQIHGQTL